MGATITPGQGAAAAAGTDTMGRATIDFSTGAEQATVTVADSGVGASSKIVAGMAYAAPPDGRDLDELELDQFEVKPGNLVVGASFDLLVTCLTGWAHGQFSVDYVRN
jgi:hypothetical protein